LAQYLNTTAERIPRSLVDHGREAPAKNVLSGTDSFPPSEGLDEILSRHIEKGQTAREIAAEGFDRQLVDKTLRQFDRAELWRRHAPQVLQVSDRAFGLGRRLPVARRYE
jgi:NAD+ synthase (glutamine-hydrolysing)